jgi:hypothetical protein
MPDMKRREFITLLGGAAAAWPLAARAQSQPKMLRVGFVGVQPRESPLYAAFLERMTELGYREGRNFTFEYIQTPNIDGYEKGYRELAGRKVDVFLAVGNERALLAARAAAEGGPIAFLAINFDQRVQPNSCIPCRNAPIRACASGSSAAKVISTPMRRTRSGCCARAASGHAAAAPHSVNMNSRRRMWIAMRPLPPEVVCMQ